MKKFALLFLVVFCFEFSNGQMLSDFENWHNYTSGTVALTVPNGWSCTDSLTGYYGNLTNPGATFLPMASKEIPGNGGVGTAVRATTVSQPAINGFIGAGPMPCLVSNAVINVDVNTGDFIYVGGTPLAYNPFVASMWVKNNPASGDATRITLLAIDDSDGGDSIVSVADTVLANTIGNFTQITLPFVMQNPSFSTTKLRAIISSSANYSIDATPVFINLVDGTSIIVDDIMISAPNGISQYLISAKEAMVYPTIFDNLLHVNFKLGEKGDYTFNISDMQGRRVLSFGLNENLNTLDVSSLSAGHYIFDILKGNSIVQTGKISK